VISVRVSGVGGLAVDSS